MALFRVNFCLLRKDILARPQASVVPGSSLDIGSPLHPRPSPRHAYSPLSEVASLWLTRLV